MKGDLHQSNVTDTVDTTDEPLTSPIQDNPAEMEDDEEQVSEYVIILYFSYKFGLLVRLEYDFPVSILEMEN